MDWPARSPDLNPIEHVWAILYRSISQGYHPPMTIQELTNILRHELEPLALQTVQNLVRSMPRRCQECCVARGGHTHYWQEKVTNLRMSMTFEIIWRKDGGFSNIYANSSLTSYRPWFVNWLPMFAINMLQIKLFIFLNRCFIIIIQHLYTMRKYVFAHLIVLSSV